MPVNARPLYAMGTVRQILQIQTKVSRPIVRSVSIALRKLLHGLLPISPPYSPAKQLSRYRNWRLPVRLQRSRIRTLQGI